MKRLLAALTTVAVSTTVLGMAVPASAAGDARADLKAALDASVEAFAGAMEYRWEDQKSGRALDGGSTSATAWQSDQDGFLMVQDRADGWAALRADYVLSTLPKGDVAPARAIMEDDGVTESDFVPLPEDWAKEALTFDEDPVTMAREAVSEARSVRKESSGAASQYTLSFGGSTPKRVVVMIFSDGLLRSVEDSAGVTSEVTAYGDAVFSPDFSDAVVAESNVLDQIIAVSWHRALFESTVSGQVKMFNAVWLNEGRPVSLPALRKYLQRNLADEGVTVKQFKKFLRVCGTKTDDAPSFAAPCVRVLIQQRNSQAYVVYP